MKRSSKLRLLVFTILALVTIGSLIMTSNSEAQEQRALYLDVTKPIDARVEDLLSRMTLEEKLAVVYADSKFTTAAIPRLGIPRRWLSDGPHGVREDVGPDTWKPAGRTDDFSTLMPALIGLASTWSPELASAYGKVIGGSKTARKTDHAWTRHEYHADSA